MSKCGRVWVSFVADRAAVAPRKGGAISSVPSGIRALELSRVVFGFLHVTSCSIV